MHYQNILLISAFLGFSMAGPAVPLTKQPCYNAADPDQGIGNYCACSDGTCWEINNVTAGDASKNHCDPTGASQYMSCPPNPEDFN